VSSAETAILYYFLFLLRYLVHFFFSSRRRHTRFSRDWSSDVCSSDLFPFRISPHMVVHPPAGWQRWAMAAYPRRISPNIFWAPRSEERRVGKECRARGRPYD